MWSIFNYFCAYLRINYLTQKYFKPSFSFLPQILSRQPSLTSCQSGINAIDQASVLKKKTKNKQTQNQTKRKKTNQPNKKTNKKQKKHCQKSYDVLLSFSIPLFCLFFIAFIFLIVFINYRFSSLYSFLQKKFFFFCAEEKKKIVID